MHAQVFQAAQYSTSACRSSKYQICLLCSIKCINSACWGASSPVLSVPSSTPLTANGLVVPCAVVPVEACSVMYTALAFSSNRDGRPAAGVAGRRPLWRSYSLSGECSAGRSRLRACQTLREARAPAEQEAVTPATDGRPRAKQRFLNSPPPPTRPPGHSMNPAAPGRLCGNPAPASWRRLSCPPGQAPTGSGLTGTRCGPTAPSGYRALPGLD